jgi:hypothetical protein
LGAANLIYDLNDLKLDSDDVGDEDLSYASGGEEREISESI